MTVVTKQEQAIINHAKDHLSLSENEIHVSRTPIPELPDYLDVFFLEKEGSYGNIYYRYVISDGDLFCSSDKDSLERLLKKGRYLEKKHLDADELIILFRILKVQMRDTTVVRAEDLLSDGMLNQHANQISMPKLHDSKDGVEIVFWTTSLRHPTPQKWVLRILSDYTIEYQS